MCRYLLQFSYFFSLSQIDNEKVVDNHIFIVDIRLNVLSFIFIFVLIFWGYAIFNPLVTVYLEANNHGFRPVSKSAHGPVQELAHPPLPTGDKI